METERKTIEIRPGERPRPDAVLPEQVDRERAVVLELGAQRLTAVPLSEGAARRFSSLLATIPARAYEDGGRFLGQEVQPMEELLRERLRGFDAVGKIPLVQSMCLAGIEVYATPEAEAALRRWNAEFLRFATPFRFNVPRELVDLSVSREADVEGPFVDERYAAEVAANLRKLDKLGLTDPAKPFYLRRYQAEDAAALAVKPFAYVGHAMGLGKTAICVAESLLAGGKRNLVVAPATTIGSAESGWIHEIVRQGVPAENVHVVRSPEDLPNRRVQETASDWPHYYLVDYVTLAKENRVWSAMTCPRCGSAIPPEAKGVCSGTYQPLGLPPESCRWNAAEWDWCPDCSAKEIKRYGGHVGLVPDAVKAKLKNDWTGGFCRGCGFRLVRRQATKARLAKGLTEARPIWRCVKRGEFSGLYVDESHFIRNGDSKRSRAVRMLRGAKRVRIVTGTMVANLVEDCYWQLMRLCPRAIFPIGGAPKRLLSWTADQRGYKSKAGLGQFKSMFDGGVLSSGTGGGDVHALHDAAKFWRTMASFMIRRREDDPDVERDVQLPEIEFLATPVTPSLAETAVYRKALGDLKRKMAAEGIDVSEMNDMAASVHLQPLRQIAVCPDQDETFALGSPIAKDAEVLRIVLEAKARKAKTVVFVPFVDAVHRLADMLEGQGIAVAGIDGGVAGPKKIKTIVDWRTKAEPTVLVATTGGAMGTGINLTPAEGVTDFTVDTVVFCAPEWTPTAMAQAWSRVHRFGQTEKVKVRFLFNEGTIEERMQRDLSAKLRTAMKAIDRVDGEEVFLSRPKEIVAEILAAAA
jgi:hypothetical protein